MLFNIAAIVALRWLSTAAQIGPASLSLWVLGAISFFVPSALTVLELSSRLPGEGGVYLWSKAAFGDMHSFIAGWSYWMSNLVFFPSLLMYSSGVFLYIHGGAWLALAENPIYTSGFCLGVLWFATALNIFGLKHAKWMQNVGGMATWAAGALVLFGGAVAWHRFGTATQLTAHSLVPHLNSVATLTSFATIALAYTGLELGPTLGGEIKDPRRTIARAMLIASALIAVIYIAGTAALLVALPAQRISIITGIPQALAAVGTRAGIPSFGTVAAVLLTLSQIGALGAWITGTARLPFLFGIDQDLPKALGSVHRKFGSPYVALLTQGVLATFVLIAAISGSAIHEAYIMLIDMTLILTFVPLLYMFAALPTLRRRAAGKHPEDMLIPGGLLGCWLVAGLGFTITLLAVVVAMVPPADSANRAVSAIKVIGGCAMIIALGLTFHLRGRRIANDGNGNIRR